MEMFSLSLLPHGMMRFVVAVLYLELQLQLQWCGVLGQQTYVNNHQLDCYNQNFNSSTKGFLCNGVQSSCQSYLTFRSNPPYASAVTISYLLTNYSTPPTLIASINDLASDVATIPTDTQLIIPLNCSCLGTQYYQHNATYRIKDITETYFTIANNTYQGLSTCQSLIDQNPVGDHNLSVGLDVLVPLRCACPTRNQTASGIKYLLTYMVTWGDTISSIADLFRVREQTILDANKLSQDTSIFPFTPILVPLTTPPTKIVPSSSPPAPSPPPPPPPAPSSSSKKWVYIGVGIGGGLLLLLVALFLFCFCRRQRSQKPKPVSNSTSTQPKAFSSEYSPLPENNKSSLSSSLPFSSQSQGFRDAVESLTVYKFENLQSATGNFSKGNIIKGSVYKGSFKGDDAAIKVMKGDVSTEINILKKINHSNIIRLSGFCVHQGNTYLVYECAENGSLTDSLHSNNQQSLSWNHRVQIAYDVANALNYLHNYTNPPYIHKNLKTSNILLDANFRAKVANFGLARSVDAGHEGGLQLTRHVFGTQGYMAPEYIQNGVVTPKLDVFAFGVVILELLSGREPAADDNKNGEQLLSSSISNVLEQGNVREQLRGFIDPSLRNEYPLDLAFSMAQLAKVCVSHDLNARPSMSEVFNTLSKILSSLSEWDPSDELELDHSRSLGSGR